MSDESTNDTDKNRIYYLNEYDDVNQVTFRIAGNLKCNKIATSCSTNEHDLINEQFDRILTDDLQSISFLIKQSSVLLSLENQFESKNVDLNQTCANTFKINAKFDSIKDSLQNYIHVDLLRNITSSSNRTEYFSPVFKHYNGIQRLQIHQIPIDIIVFIDSNTKLNVLFSIFRDKLALQLETIRQCFLSFYKNDSNFKPEIYHFWIDEEVNSLITIVYPNNLSDDQLKPCRQEIHHSLNIPLTKSYIRRVDAYQFSSKAQDSKNNEINIAYLRNPHTHAKPSGIKDGKQTFVQGTYVYFHYMQDFNDNGWGCAYRSFQTIFSWFKLQDYTNLPIPTHRDIQQALFDIGDKPRDFIGSSKWIGSMEISFCLSKMLNVESKIISVSSGSELSEKAREVEYHFETEGTPIMIGGGLYAYTIVGVDFNELTGDVKYCIVDPHYTGSEDIKTIVNKGWCAWKDSKFWDENVFYNLCCPLRSSMF